MFDADQVPAQYLSFITLKDNEKTYWPDGVAEGIVNDT